MRLCHATAVLFVFAAIVGTAPAAYATPACGCRQNDASGVDDLGGSTPSPKSSPGAGAPRQDSASKAKEPPARRILEIELNVFGRRYNFELITTVPSAALRPERSSPAAPAVPAPAPEAIG